MIENNMSDIAHTEYALFDNLIEQNRRMIRILCWRHSSGDEELCAELVQECYLAIWFRLGTLRRGSIALQQRAWVAWQCRSVFSHRKRKDRPIWLPVDALAESIPSPDNDNSLREQIEELAVDLNAKERQLLDLLLEGYQLTEIAHMWGITYSAVKKKKQRMIEKMKARTKGDRKP